MAANNWLKVVTIVVFGAALASSIYYRFFGFHWG